MAWRSAPAPTRRPNSYLARGSTPEDRVLLAEPVGRRLLVTDYDNMVVRNDLAELVPETEVSDALVEVMELEHEYAASAQQLSPEATEEGGENGGGDVVFPCGRCIWLDGYFT